MIPLKEVEFLAKKVFGKNVISVWQVNKTTIRIELTKDSFIDIFQSIRHSTKFAFHGKISIGRIFRLDCRPERKYQKLSTFPWHFHKESEENVIASPFATNKRPAVIQFFKFLREKSRNIK